MLVDLSHSHFGRDVVFLYSIYDETKNSQILGGGARVERGTRGFKGLETCWHGYLFII